jgi:hypothetical protein
VIGYFALAGQVLAAGDLVGEYGREQILGAHPLQRRRNLGAALEARQREPHGAFQRHA